MILGVRYFSMRKSNRSQTYGRFTLASLSGLDATSILPLSNEGTVATADDGSEAVSRTGLDGTGGAADGTSPHFPHRTVRSVYSGFQVNDASHFGHATWSCMALIPVTRR
jgi:hypothetical protein